MLIISLTGCKTKDSYTYEEHYERVQKLIENNYIKKGYAEHYELYPVYDINDEFLYFGIDFYPKGFCFVKIEDKNIGFIHRTMYKANTDPLCNSWENYVLVNGEKKYVYGKKFYTNSPYKISNIENEKRYLIKIGEENDTIFNTYISVQRTSFLTAA